MTSAIWLPLRSSPNTLFINTLNLVYDSVGVNSPAKTCNQIFLCGISLHGDHYGRTMDLCWIPSTTLVNFFVKSDVCVLAQMIEDIKGYESKVIKCYHTVLQSKWNKTVIMLILLIVSALLYPLFYQFIIFLSSLNDVVFPSSTMLYCKNHSIYSDVSNLWNIYLNPFLVYI